MTRYIVDLGLRVLKNSSNSVLTLNKENLNETKNETSLQNPPKSLKNTMESE